MLWTMWFEAVAPLRAACSRTRTFHWIFGGGLELIHFRRLW